MQATSTAGAALEGFLWSHDGVISPVSNTESTRLLCNPKRNCSPIHKGHAMSKRPLLMLQVYKMTCQHIQHARNEHSSQLAAPPLLQDHMSPLGRKFPTTDLQQMP